MVTGACANNPVPGPVQGIAAGARRLGADMARHKEAVKDGVGRPGHVLTDARHLASADASGCAASARRVA